MKMKKAASMLLVASLLVFPTCGKSKDGKKEGSASKPSAVVPAAPMGISTVSGDGQVTLKWQAAAGAATYNVYVSQIAGTPQNKAEKVAGIKGVSYEHKGLKNNAMYYYRVSAANEGGEGTASGETGAMPKAVPPAVPGGVAATGGTGHITVKWTPVAGATAYNIYFSTKPQVKKSERTKIAGVTHAVYEHKDVKREKMYFYVVSAMNDGGESPLSTESGAMP